MKLVNQFDIHEISGKAIKEVDPGGLEISIKFAFKPVEDPQMSGKQEAGREIQKLEARHKILEYNLQLHLVISLCVL